MVNTSSRKRRRGADTGSDAEPEKEYQVEAIIDKRVRGKKIEYMLKWKGYSHAENTVSDVRSFRCKRDVLHFNDSFLRRSLSAEFG